MSTRPTLLQAITIVLVLAVAQRPAAAQGKSPFHLELQDAAGVRSTPARTKADKNSATFTIDREYQPGDQLVLSGPVRLAAKLDASEPGCLLYITSASNFEIPYGREEKQTGSAYAPEAFAGESHQITLRALTKRELKSYRNLALNPCDTLRLDPQPPPAEHPDARYSDPANMFPHATSNSVSRNLYDFAARNAIDGFTQNGHHGVWPFQSWGPQLRLDLWWKLDFGRPVELDKIRLMVRADFPHDSYWKTATIEFSDGSKETIRLAAKPEFQDFPFRKRKVTSFRLTNLVPEDEKRWCAFIEVEAWGRDLP
jgi:hypothetical protein